jgi:hypothetical protein
MFPLLYFTFSSSSSSKSPPRTKTDLLNSLFVPPLLKNKLLIKNSASKGRSLFAVKAYKPNQLIFAIPPLAAHVSPFGGDAGEGFEDQSDNAGEGLCMNCYRPLVNGECRPALFKAAEDNKNDDDDCLMALNEPCVDGALVGTDRQYTENYLQLVNHQANVSIVATETPSSSSTSSSTSSSSSSSSSDLPAPTTPPVKHWIPEVLIYPTSDDETKERSISHRHPSLAYKLALRSLFEDGANSSNKTNQQAIDIDRASKSPTFESLKHLTNVSLIDPVDNGSMDSEFFIPFSDYTLLKQALVSQGLDVMPIQKKGPVNPEGGSALHPESSANKRPPPQTQASIQAQHRQSQFRANGSKREGGGWFNYAHYKAIMLRMPLNAFMFDVQKVMTGSAVYGLASFINHSCGGPSTVALSDTKDEGDNNTSITNPLSGNAVVQFHQSSGSWMFLHAGPEGIAEGQEISIQYDWGRDYPVGGEDASLAGKALTLLSQVTSSKRRSMPEGTIYGQQEKQEKGSDFFGLNTSSSSKDVDITTTHERQLRRRDWLADTYGFTCQCGLCTAAWEWKLGNDSGGGDGEQKSSKDDETVAPTAPLKFVDKGEDIVESSKVVGEIKLKKKKGGKGGGKKR